MVDDIELAPDERLAILRREATSRSLELTGAREAYRTEVRHMTDEELQAEIADYAKRVGE